MTDTKWSEWINWAATGYSVCPLEDGTLSQVLFSSGDRACDNKCPEEWDWNDTGGLGTICAYRYEMSDVSISATWSGLITLAGRHDKADARMDNIARNGNDGEHYPPAEQSMPADLEDLARTVLEWNESLDRVCKHTIGVEWFSSEHYPGRHGYSEGELLQARRDLGLVTTEGEDEAFDAIGKRDVFEEIAEGFDDLEKGNFTSYWIQGVSTAADMINHPPHYQSDNGIECIDAIRAALGKEGFIAYCRGNVIKYQWRLKANPAEDQGKSVWYANRAREAMEE
jgi:hypothetical protein